MGCREHQHNHRQGWMCHRWWHMGHVRQGMPAGWLGVHGEVMDATTVRILCSVVAIVHYWAQSSCAGRRKTSPAERRAKGEGSSPRLFFYRFLFIYYSSVPSDSPSSLDTGDSLTGTIDPPFSCSLSLIFFNISSPTFLLSFKNCLVASYPLPSLVSP